MEVGSNMQSKYGNVSMRSTKHQKKKQKHSTKNNLNLIHYQHASMPAAKILKLVNSRCPGNTFLAPSRSMRVTFYYSSCLLTCLFTCLFIICVLSLFFFFFRFRPFCSIALETNSTPGHFKPTFTQPKKKPRIFQTTKKSSIAWKKDGTLVQHLPLSQLSCKVGL